MIHINDAKRRTLVYEEDLAELGKLMGYNLRAIRKARKLSINKLAYMANIPVCTVGRLEKSKYVTAHISTWVQICNALGVHLDDLLTTRLTFREPTEEEKRNAKRQDG